MKKVDIVIPITFQSGRKTMIVIKAEISGEIPDPAKVIRIDEPIVLSTGEETEGKNDG